MHKYKITSLFVIGITSFFAFSSAVLAAFPDVDSSHPHFDAVEYVQSNNIVSGFSDGEYKPDQSITRAEFTKIIINAIYKETIANDGDLMVIAGNLGTRMGGGTDGEITYYSNFPDVETYSEESRGRQYCVINELNEENCDSWFEIQEVKTGNVFSIQVGIAKASGVINGYSDGNFYPENPITVAEASKIISNAYQFTSGNSTGTDVFKIYIDALAQQNAIPDTVVDKEDSLTRGQMAEFIYRLENDITDKASKSYDEINDYRTKNLAYFTENNAIYAVDINSKTKTNVIDINDFSGGSAELGSFSPIMSPNKSLIAYLNSQNKPEIYNIFTKQLTPIDTTSVANFTDNSLEIYLAGWSPNSDRIILGFSCKINLGDSLTECDQSLDTINKFYLFDLQANQLNPLTFLPEGYFRGWMKNTDNEILFSTSDFDTQTYRLVSVNLDTQEQSEITNTLHFGSEFNISEDGKTLLYSTAFDSEAAVLYDIESKTIIENYALDTLDLDPLFFPSSNSNFLYTKRIKTPCELGGLCPIYHLYKYENDTSTPLITEQFARRSSWFSDSTILISLDEDRYDHNDTESIAIFDVKTNQLNILYSNTATNLQLVDF